MDDWGGGEPELLVAVCWEGLNGQEVLVTVRKMVLEAGSCFKEPLVASLSD